MSYTKDLHFQQVFLIAGAPKGDKMRSDWYWNKTVQHAFLYRTITSFLCVTTFLVVFIAMVSLYNVLMEMW